MNKIIKRLLIVFLLLFSIFISGCSSLVVSQKYIYDDSNYNIGNKAYNEVVEEIEIDWIIGNINILKSSNHEVIVREETDIDIEELYQVHSIINNKKLDIKFSGSTLNLNYKYKIKNLYVFLPTTIQKIVINNVSADIHINQVEINDLELNSVSGDIIIEDTSINELDLENVSGEIIILDNKIKDIEIESVSGNIGLSFLGLPDNFEVSTTSANVTLYIAEDDKITVEFETISGNLSSKIEYKKVGDSYLFNGGGITFDASSISGNLKIIDQ